MHGPTPASPLSIFRDWARRVRERAWSPRADGLSKLIGDAGLASVRLKFVGARRWRPNRRAVLVVGCVRAIASALNRSQPLVSGLLDAFPGSAALFYEDAPRDEDGTRSLLREWAARDDRVRLLLADGVPETGGLRGWEREQRLALCRNALFLEAQRQELPPSSVIVSLDLDCAHPPVAELAAAVRSMGAPDRPWDVLTANSMPRYRDKWALRSQRLGVDYDCMTERERVRSDGDCFAHSIRVDRAAPPFAVESAFNGLGIYAAGPLLARARHCRYKGTQVVLAKGEGRRGFAKRKDSVCEHVPFNLCLRRAGLAVAVAPSLVTNCFPSRTDFLPRWLTDVTSSGEARRQSVPKHRYELRRGALRQTPSHLRGAVEWRTWTRVPCRNNESCFYCTPDTLLEGSGPPDAEYPSTSAAMCAWRFFWLEDAMAACLRQPWCVGVQLDGGKRCHAPFHVEGRPHGVVDEHPRPNASVLWRGEAQAGGWSVDPGACVGAGRRARGGGAGQTS